MAPASHPDNHPPYLGSSLSRFIMSASGDRQDTKLSASEWNRSLNTMVGRLCQLGLAYGESSGLSNSFRRQKDNKEMYEWDSTNKFEVVSIEYRAEEAGHVFTVESRVWLEGTEEPLLDTRTAKTKWAHGYQRGHTYYAWSQFPEDGEDLRTGPSNVTFATRPDNDSYQSAVQAGSSRSIPDSPVEVETMQRSEEEETKIKVELADLDRPIKREFDDSDEETKKRVKIEREDSE